MKSLLFAFLHVSLQYGPLEGDIAAQKKKNDEDISPKILVKSSDTKLKAAVCNLFWLKMIQIQYLRKYITSQCSKLSPYFSPIHNGSLIMFFNLSFAGRFSWETWHCIITSRL